MIYFVLAVFIFLTGYLLFRLVQLKRAMKEAAKELEEISANLDANRILRLSAPNRSYERLLGAINKNLLAIREKRIFYEKKELAFKREIENISHDLRTPLTAILGYLQMLKEAPLSEQQKEYLGIVVRRAGNMQELTNRFYELCQVTDRDYHIKLSDIDAGRILREACVDHYELLKKSELDMELQIPDKPLMIRGEKEALERIVHNLLQNASRYAESKLCVSANEDKQSGVVNIVFSNDVLPKKRVADPARLFERFYMQEQARRNDGSGLGLTITKALVRHMNGEIAAEYEETEGGLFLNIRLVFSYSGSFTDVQKP